MRGMCPKKSTTVICMATTLHSIATGNMTPSYRVLADGTIRPVYFYSVDISLEFSVNKLRDRGQPGRQNHCDQRAGFCCGISAKGWDCNIMDKQIDFRMITPCGEMLRRLPEKAGRFFARAAWKAAGNARNGSSLAAALSFFAA